MPNYEPYRGEPTKSGDLAPDYVELETTRWNSVPQEDHESTAYDPSQLIERTSTRSTKNDMETQLPLGQAIKKDPKIAGYCLAMTIPIIGWGYDLLVVGAITGEDSFKADYGKLIDGEMTIPGNWLSLWMGLPPAGAAAGAMLGGWLQNRIGRKFSLMIGSIISAGAIACIFFSHLPPEPDTKRVVITVGLTFQGFTVGIIKTTCLTWVSENAPTALRGPAMALFPTFTLIGQLIGAIVVYAVNQMGSKNGYLGAFGSQWILVLGPFTLSCLMPESPAHLIRTNQEERAIRSATRLFGPKMNPYSALEKIRETIEEEKATTASVSYWACFKGSNLRRTMIVILANVIPALFGLELLSNATVFLQSIGMASGPSLLIMIGGIIAGMVANGIGFWLLSRTGRRSMTIVSMAIASLLWGVMGISGFWSGPALTWLAAGLMISVIVVCGLGCWPAGYAIMGETSSLQLRSLTHGIGSVASQAASITLAVLLPMLFSKDKAALGAKTAFVFCGLCIIGVVLAWLWIPEMKGRSMIELDHMFEMRLPTRKFKSFKMETHEIQEASPLAERGA
ncbi:MFS domain-containing protein [Fusarium sp. LHS14.1]|nr:MFS domain-containing protein [Fusarium sp. LHS14.1]